MVPGRDDDGDLLAHGWSPSTRLRVATYLVVGALLLAHPLVGGLPDAVGLTGSGTYDVVSVEPDGENVAFSGVDGADSVWVKLYRAGGLSFVDCYPPAASRECGLESALTDQSLTAESRPIGWTGYTYHDGFYERVATDREDGAELGLRPVPATAVLANVSIPERDWPRPVRRAIEQGTLQTDSPIAHAGTVLERDGSYYLLLPDSPVPRDEPVDPLIGTLSAVLGTLAVLRANRAHDAEEADETS